MPPPKPVVPGAPWQVWQKARSCLACVPWKDEPPTAGSAQAEPREWLASGPSHSHPMWLCVWQVTVQLWFEAV